MKGSVELASFESSVLKNNPLGDPFIRQFPVYLPPSYDGKKSFPVIYLLAGFASTGISFLNFRFGRPTLPEQIDRLIVSEGMNEAIVVMPDCMTKFGGSQYLNSPAFGNYEDYLINELIPWIDRSFKTRPEARAVAGKSSGGFGALHLCMNHPGVFQALACHSGDMNFELCYAPDFPHVCRVLENYDYRIRNFYKAYDEALKKPKHAFGVINIVGMAAAYSPDATKSFPENIRLPFDLKTCERKQHIWQEWLSKDPLHQIEDSKKQSALKSMRGIFIDCGTEDEFNLQFGARVFCRKLSKYGITFTYEEFPDNHMDTSYRYDVSLPKLVASSMLS